MSNQALWVPCNDVVRDRAIRIIAHRVTSSGVVTAWVMRYLDGTFGYMKPGDVRQSKPYPTEDAAKFAAELSI